MSPHPGGQVRLSQFGRFVQVLCFLVGSSGWAALVGCAGVAPRPSPDPAVAAPQPPSPPPPPEPVLLRGVPPVDAVLALEAMQRQAAQDAAQQGRWSEAAWAWNVVLALSPDDATALTARNQAERAASQAVADTLVKARQAQQRGDAETALRGYVAALSNLPLYSAAYTTDHAAALAAPPALPAFTEAADALRAIERDRARRLHLSGASRHSFARMMGVGAAEASKTTGSPAAAPKDPGVVERARLLSENGEIEAAIALLKATSKAPPADAAVNRMLKELLARQARTPTAAKGSIKPRDASRGTGG